jgi:hypothetical protein
MARRGRGSGGRPGSWVTVLAACKGGFSPSNGECRGLPLRRLRALLWFSSGMPPPPLLIPPYYLQPSFFSYCLGLASSSVSRRQEAVIYPSSHYAIPPFDTKSETRRCRSDARHSHVEYLEVVNERASALEAHGLVLRGGGGTKIQVSRRLDTLHNEITTGCIHVGLNHRQFHDFSFLSNGTEYHIP